MVGLLRRGDILLVNFKPAHDSEANYIRPAILISNNDVNAHAHVVVVVPLTSNIEAIYPSQLFLPVNCCNLDRNSKAQTELIRHINVNRIIKTLGYVPEDLMLELDRRLREHLSL